MADRQRHGEQRDPKREERIQEAGDGCRVRSGEIQPPEENTEPEKGTGRSCGEMD